MRNRRAKPQQAVEVDETIMQELLDQPFIKDNVSLMDAEFVQWFKEHLVSSGIYAQYVRERGEGGDHASV